MENRPAITVLKTNRLYSVLKWVSLACSKDPYRPQMAGVMVEEDALIATDGYRIHRAYAEPGWSPGYYSITTGKEVTVLTPNELTFPDWKAVVPKETKEFGSFGSYSCKPALRGTNPDFSLHVFKLYHRTGACFNLSFLADLLPGVWEVKGEEGPGKPFEFHHAAPPDRYALIMTCEVREK